jgi:hypothetical protein
VVFAVLLLIAPSMGAAPAAGTSAPPAPARILPHWHLVSLSALTPPTRQSGGMVYDPLHHEYVLFGGYATSGPLGDTWVFVNGQWKDLTLNLTVAPSPRWYFSLVWDPAARYVLLFGGRNTTADLNDTWAFNGTTWKDLNLTVAPPPMTSGRAVYYPPYHGVFQYGGYSIMPGAPSSYNSSWLFAHGGWTNITARVRGAPADPHPLTYATYDPASSQVIFTGGPGTGNASCTVPSYTWSFAHGTFQNLSAGLAVEPSLAAGSRMLAYDPTYAGLVLYGGWDGPGCYSFSNATWVFSHGAWSALRFTKNPGPLWDGEMAANPDDRSILLFSGNQYPYTGVQSTQTWRLTA